MPFQIAYAVSIHRAQGLEYESVKVVITDANEDDISHSILYTALTHVRENVQVFWTPETQTAVIRKLERKTNMKDVRILTERRGITRHFLTAPHVSFRGALALISTPARCRAR